jgi:hypothetical protein
MLQFTEEGTKVLPAAKKVCHRGAEAWKLDLYFSVIQCFRGNI